MAYFMFRTQIISKSNRSAVASAAYRSGESLYSERDGLTKDYTKRSVKPDSFILKPENAPDWVMDREKLWNEVEKIEKQHNSQLAREIVVSLPTLLPHEKQKELIKEFCDEQLVNSGMVADVAIHRDKKHNPHAHIMLTMRPFNEDGTWGNKRKKINGKSIHLTDWNNKEKLIEWRKQYALKINNKFKELNINERVSHESYEKQGIAKLPQIRLSREAYQAEKRAKKNAEINSEKYEPVTYYGKLNKEIAEINKEIKLLEKQKIVNLSEHVNDLQDKKDFDKIRKNYNLNSAQKSALQMIAKRAKSYVDYSIAQKIFLDIKEGNWRKQIDAKKMELTAEKNLINKIHFAYQENPKNILKYGIIPEDYGSVMKDKISAYKEKESNFQELFAKYERVLKKAELGYEVQKNILDQEFNYLYQEQEDIFNSDEKYLAVKYFKDHGKILKHHKIKEYAVNNSIESTRPTIVQQTNNISKSIFIVNKAIKKHQREKIALLQNREFEKVYELDKKIEQYQLRLKVLSKEIDGNIKYLQANLSSVYKNRGIEKVSQPEVLVKLYELNKLGKSSGNLNKDLKMLNKLVSKENDMLSKKTEINNNTNKSYANHISNSFIQSIESIRQANEQNKAYDLNKNKKRRRGRHEKNHENEL